MVLFVEPAVVQAVWRLLPKLDRFRSDADGSPILGALGRRLHRLLEMFMARPERRKVADWSALSRDDRLELVGEVTLVEQFECERALGDYGSSDDMYLASEGRPVEQQGDIRGLLGLVFLSGPERARERERVRVESLQRHGPCRWASARADGHERHRLWGRRIGLVRV